jgi:type I restriction enzyme S subunit
VSDVLTLRNGYAFKTTEWTPSGRPIIRIQNLKSNAATYNYYDGILPDRFKAMRGDLLFAWSGTPGTSFGAHIWDGPEPEAWINQHIFRVGFSPDEYDRDFLKLALNNNLGNYISEAQGGVGLAHITKAKLNDSLLVTPPVAVQRQIADKIARHSEMQSSALDHLNHAGRAIQNFRQAVLTAACSGRLTANWQSGLRAAAEGYPSSWQNTIFGDLAESSFYGPRFSSDLYISDGVPTIRTTDMDHYGNIILRDPPQLALDAKSLSKYRLLDGDLLVTRTGATIGKCGVYSDELGPAVPSAYLIRFRLKKNVVVPQFALLFLMSPFGRQALVGGSTATAQPNINAPAVSAIKLHLPPLDEQQEIVRRAMQMLGATDVLEERLGRAIRSVNRSPQAVLGKAFRGELIGAASPAT